MKRPPPGLVVPVEYVRCRDGDTVAVRTQMSRRVWYIRLIDCWAPERNEPGGPEAKALAERLCAAAEELYLQIPYPEDVENLLANVTFDRVPGYLWLSERRTLNKELVDAGVAMAERPQS